MTGTVDSVRLAGRLVGVGETYTDYTFAGLVEVWDGDRWAASSADETTGYTAVAARGGRPIAVGAAPRGGSIVEERVP